jgi:DNA-binding transcriptional MerR regulator
VSSRKNFSEPWAHRAGERPLRISEVARRVGISSSALRAWENLGLVAPRRTKSRYRVYTEADLRLLQRAVFLRRARGLSLAQVARATNVSVGFLSALERGQMRSSVSTLRRIARFYGTNILSLFEAAEENPRLVRPDQRKVLETTPGVRMELLAWGKAAMEPHLFRIKPGGSSGESYSHEGEEFLHILQGEFEIWLNGNEHYRLKRGDSLYFESSTPHRWRNPGRSEAWLLWVNTPPTF